MEYVLLAIVLLEGGAITYLLTKKTPSKPITIEEKERLRQERVEKDFGRLFNYNESIATRGYKDEE